MGRKRNGGQIIIRKILIPGHAKRAAQEGLKLRASLPKSQKFGLSPEEARRLNVDSGVTRARRIINNRYMYEWEVMKVAAFWSRFRNCKTPKCEGSHLLWGGRKFGFEMFKLVQMWELDS